MSDVIRDLIFSFVFGERWPYYEIEAEIKRRMRTDKINAEIKRKGGLIQMYHFCNKSEEEHMSQQAKMYWRLIVKKAFLGEFALTNNLCSFI